LLALCLLSLSLFLFLSLCFVFYDLLFLSSSLSLSLSLRKANKLIDSTLNIIYDLIQVLLKSLLKVIDNSGALVVECINVMGGSRSASLGDEIVCVVKKARPVPTDASASNGPGASSQAVAKLKKGDVARALVVRTRQEVRRLDGTYVRFDDNAVVMLNKQGQPLGNRVLGVIANECRQKRWAKIVSLAPKTI
jgi:large subunit ribosomal protein L14